MLGLLPFSKAGLNLKECSKKITRQDESGFTTDRLLHRVVHLSLMLFSLGDLPRSLGQILLNNSVPTNMKQIPVSVLRPPTKSFESATLTAQLGWQTFLPR